MSEISLTDLPSTDLQTLAERAGRDLEGATAHEIMGWALDTFHPRLAVASSMADAVLIDIATSIRADIPVVFVDTGYHFAETLGMRDAVAASKPVRMLSVTPVQSISQQGESYGDRLYERDPDLCCQLRKVRPMEEALKPFLAWASGIRRDEATSRRKIGVVEWDAKRSKIKVNPLAAWTQEEADRYTEEHQVLVNPLLSAGYASIGCEPCTRRVAPGEDARAGRWSGTGKTECGLHL
jgi:phosphoadenosine phosphosulfate reductase